MRAPSAVLFAVLALVGCNKDPEETDTDLPDSNAGPDLVHTPVTSGLEGTAIPISVTATDANGVDKVALYFRQPDQSAWDTQILTKSGDTFTGEIPGDDVVAPQVEYYFRAQDASDAHAASYFPAEGASAPVIVPVDVIGATLPYVQDFDSEDVIYYLDWNERSVGFPGYTWGVDVTKSHSGDHSVGHRRGVDGLDPLDDWLISPALDFSTLTQIEVSWWEYGDYADLADHSLWISTTSDDPTEGGFELVTELAIPSEDAWAPSSVIDLSAWAGNDAVWLAWHYEGDFTDGWWMDDVTVRELGADLHATGFGFSPEPVDPGGTTTLTLDVENRTTVASGPITVTWTVDPAYASFVTPTSHAAVDAMGTASWSTDLTIDPSFPDNSYLPLSIEATDGSRTWAWDEQIVVGVPSAAHVVLQHDTDGLLDVVLGVGDPDAPTFETPVTVAYETAGELTFDVDITDQYDLLPPAAGANRWWLRIDSDATGELQSFVIDWDGQSFASDDVGQYSAALEEMFYLPRPPEPSVSSTSTTPSRVAPGDTVDWRVTLTNLGAATIGATTVTLSSSDADVTVLTPDPVQLAASGWVEGASATVPFQVAVSEDHVDSSPVLLDLLVQDELESWELTSEIAVPWPMLRVTGVLVDDWATGDNDGLLDDGEKAYLEIDLTNLGDLDTFGSVSCTLSQTGGSASATLHTSTGSFGLVTAGDTKNEDNFQLTASGSDGDDLEMKLACVDTTGFTYESSFVLVIGEPPWLWISAVDDDCGDAVGGYELDLKNGRYRSDGTTLDIEIESCTPFDPSTAFLEAWSMPSGADYRFYQLVVQSGVGKVRGYDGSFVTLSSPTVSTPDDTHLLISVDLTTMGLRSASLPTGFASGFCGGDDYYCDHMPDGWGSPYNEMYTSEFASLTW